MKPKLRILGNFHIFLAALGCLLLLTGLMGRIWLNLLIALVLVSGVFAFIRRRRVMVVGAVLALATVAATVIAILVTGRGWAIARQSLLALFLVFTAAVLLQVALSSGRITLEKLSGAVCVYLLIGAIWACSRSSKWRLRVRSDSRRRRPRRWRRRCNTGSPAGSWSTSALSP